MILAHSLECVPEAHISYQTRIRDSPKLLWESSIPQDEIGGLWRCEHKRSQRLHPTSSRTCFCQHDDEVQCFIPLSSYTGQDFARRPAYMPSNQHSWRVLGSRVRKIDSPSILLLISQFIQSSYVAHVRKHCKHKNNLHYVRIKPSISTCTLSQGLSRPHRHSEWI